MSNIKDSEKATVASRITDKTVDYSIAKQDLGTTFDEIIDLLGAVLVNEDLTYPVGFVVYTASPYAIYACKVEDADGDVSNPTNWLKIAGSGLPYLISDTEVYDTVVAYQGSNYYVSLAIDLNAKAGCFFALRLTGIAATNVSQLGYAVTVDATTALEGTSIILQTDTNGIGFSTLAITTSYGTYNEKLAMGSTYLLLKTTDTTDTDGYILTKIASTGIRDVTTSGFISSIGKYLVPAGASFQLPLAVGLFGEQVQLLLKASGSITPSLSGSDSIVNVGSLSYNLPKMTFTSDGVDKWYYTA